MTPMRRITTDALLEALRALDRAPAIAEGLVA